MQQSSSHMVKVGILIGVLGLCLGLAPLGCSSEPENPDLDPCDGPGWRDCFGHLDGRHAGHQQTRTCLVRNTPLAIP